MAWKTLPHSPVSPVIPGIWQVQGTLPGGNPLPRTMAIWALPDGGLCIHSAINLDEPAMDILLELGEPRVLVVPNRFHRMDAQAWKERFPALEVLAPTAARQQVDKVIKTDGACEDRLPALGTECLQGGGLKPLELVYKVPGSDGGHALVFTDTFFNLPEHFGGFTGLLMRYITGSTGIVGISRLGRLLGMSSASKYADWLEAQKTAELRALIPGHGAPFVGPEACADALDQAIQNLR